MRSHLFQIQKHVPLNLAITRRMGQLMNLFGLTLRKVNSMSFHHSLDMELVPGDICYITGPSGAGKSILMREMSRLVPPGQQVGIEDIELKPDQSVIDSIDSDLFEAVDILCKAGLSDSLAMLQAPARLSSGQQFRYRLARALLTRKPVIFADEFMASVETLSAVIICRRLRDIATQTQRIFIFAGVGDYFIPDLQPDVVVIKSAIRPTRLIWHNPDRNIKHQNAKGKMTEQNLK